MEEQVYLKYGAKIALRSTLNNNYVKVNHNEGIAVASGHHPILYVSDLEVSKGEELTILNFEDRDSREPVTFGSSICLQTAEGFFFTFKGSGEMRVEQNQRYEEGSYSIAKLTKWTILDARKVTNREKVTPFNDICLKSPFGHFFQVEAQSDDLISANGPEVSHACIFKVVKASIPQLPDWLFKRPHLNHNNITSQYASFVEYSQSSRRVEERPQNLGNFPVDIQETFLIEDLLFAMTSIEGVYIKRKQVQSNANGMSINTGNEAQANLEYQIEPYLAQPSCDFSLQFLVNKMLPLCSNHDYIQEFVNVHSQFDFGLVSHALCGAIRVLLKEYLLLVTQLDTEFMKADLTLQKVWFYLQNSIRIMDNLKRLAVDAGNKKGGALLNVIYKLMISSSDSSIRDFFAFLLEKASLPYFQILKKWIFSGVLEDPFEEFIVKENKNCKKENIEADLNDRYWQERFTYREEMVPIFLAKHKQKVLHAGKYLNVIRECGRLDIKNPYEDITSCEGFSFTKITVENLANERAQASSASAAPNSDVAMNDETAENNNGSGAAVDEEKKGESHMIDTSEQQLLNGVKKVPQRPAQPAAAATDKQQLQQQAMYDFYEPIEKAYEWNSARLLEMIMGECQLIQRLDSMNHYFFLNRGDLFTHFFDGCGDVLEKQSQDVKMERLESQLEMAIRTSSVNSDPFKDDVTCVLNGYALSDQLFVTWITRGALGNKAFSGIAGQGQNSNSYMSRVTTSSGTLKVHEAFTLDYKVRWPLTLIISKKAINKYQLLFRHLLQCKYAEKYLEQAWLQHQSTKDCNVQSHLQQTYALRHRMLQYCKNYMYYMQVEVLEPNYRKLKAQLGTVKTIDDIMMHHSNFLDECLKQCLLTDQHMVKIISNLNLRTLFFSRVIIRFFNNVKDEENLDRVRNGDANADFMDELTEYGQTPYSELNKRDQRKRRIQREAQLIKKNISENNYPSILENFERKFNDFMKELLEHLTQSRRYETHIANLAQRLDYNEYYKDNLCDGILACGMVIHEHQ